MQITWQRQHPLVQSVACNTPGTLLFMVPEKVTLVIKTFLLKCVSAAFHWVLMADISRV
jgi:hypothetical protein